MVPRLAVDAGVEARVALGVVDAHQLAALGNAAGHAVTERDGEALGTLGQDRHARRELVRVRVDQPDGGALGHQRFGYLLADGAQERVEIDLPREKRGKLDEQRQAGRHGTRQCTPKDHAASDAARPTRSSMPSRAATVRGNSFWAARSSSPTAASLRDGS